MITAGYASRCPDCDGPILEGDDIGLVEGEWVCESCVEDAGGSEDDDS